MINNNSNTINNREVNKMELSMIIAVAESFLIENLVNKINEKIDNALDLRDFEKIPALLEERKIYESI